MTPKKAEAKLELRKLAILGQHPLQPAYFDNLTDHDLETLAADIRANGLRNAIEVMPGKNQAGLAANTIIKGHQRRRALELLGEIETQVLVRYDLTMATAEEVEREFVGDNLARRQLDPLAKARAALRLFEIERGRAAGELRRTDEPEARDRVGKVINLSGRHLQRLFNILKTPVEVQNAFRAKHLGVVAAEKVAFLDAKVQMEIAKRIRAGEAPKDLVGEYVSAGDGRHRKVGDALAGFARALRVGLYDLDGRVDGLSAGSVKKYLDDLCTAHGMIAKLIAKARTASPESVRGDDFKD